MRQVDPKVLKERKNKILQAVIHHYIKTARPVASNVLTEDYHFDLSPATIRNLMAELEDDGFLTHPHTSAGRTPTDKGYRTYVDSLLELQRLVIGEEERVRQEYDYRIKELQDLLVQTSRVLSSLSQYSGFVLAPKLEKNRLQYLELISMGENKILVILVTHTGMVKHRIVEADIPRERVSELNLLLNRRLRGVALSEAKQRILEEIEESERQEHDLMSLARDLSDELFNLDEELYIEGTSNVLTLPEFQDLEPMRCLLRLNSEKDRLIHILDEGLDRDGVRVVIGSEAACEDLKDLSLVSTVYKNGEVPVGVLGIIGPKRMEYPKMMALVSAVSRMMNKMLSRLGG
ncbi:MAG: heat-inducible transcriptional repressor HrcA [Endomicrobiales bacterium]